MTPADWRRVKEAFQSAAELDTEGLEAFLDDFRRTEPDLCPELESLLRHRKETGEILGLELPDFQAEDEAELNHWVGRTIGPYRVISKLGEGGMGTVFQAIRVDDHYLKNVAIKVVRAACATKPYLRRFKSERQILASLDHPNIAHLLDGGTTEDGLPYLVMEYVAGLPIDEYCDRHSIDISARLKLFSRVCSAVEYAHQKLVIHRDLKPANILVNEDGQVKLLDFGIAKLLDPELYFQTAGADLTAAKPMTPDYASPEQVRGDRITTASDVYSLGIVLYRLLTSRPPYILAGSNPVQWGRTVLEVEPCRPSDAVDHSVDFTDAHGKVVHIDPVVIAALRGVRPTALRRRLRGDLDNIVLKALRKDPSRRYASVEQFANDIRRLLEGLPVLARPDTMSYRARKFIGRNRVPLAAVALFLLSLMTAMLVAVRQVRIANQQRALAERRFNDIRNVAYDLIFQIPDSIPYLPGATPARKVVVQSALRDLDTLMKDAPNDLSLQRGTATAYERIGDVQVGTGRANLGDTSGALESYRKALEIWLALHASNPSDATALDGLSRSYLRIGNILEGMGSYQEALGYHQKYLEISREMASSSPHQPSAK